MYKCVTCPTSNLARAMKIALEGCPAAEPNAAVDAWTDTIGKRSFNVDSEDIGGIRWHRTR